MSPTLVDADPEAGFDYPYYLHVPDDYAGDRPILVEPTNTGRPSDDFADHREAAEKRAAGGTSRRIADRLGVPYLHPVFPLPWSEPVEWTHHVHSLDAPTMRLTDGPLARIDRQLLAMIDHARERLPKRNPPVQFLLDGFSSSGVFVNRFTALHPDRVAAVSGGGYNGLLVLPLDEAPETDAIPNGDLLAGQPLRYPVGVADVPELVGTPFDGAAFRATPQFYYLGDDDPKDALLYPDTWTDPELRGAAVFTYGPRVHEHRVPTCARHYRTNDVRAVFRTYPDTGHEPTPAVDDIVTFHERALAGDSRTELDDALGGNPVGPD